MRGRASIASGWLMATAHAIPTATAKAASLLAVSGRATDALRPIDGTADRTRKTGIATEPSAMMSPQSAVIRYARQAATS